jgi:hypothetical protein
MPTTTTSYRIRVPQTAVEQVVSVAAGDGTPQGETVNLFAVFYDNHPAALAYCATLQTTASSG